MAEKKEHSNGTFRRLGSRWVAVLASVLMLTAGLVSVQAPATAEAVSASDFNPGNIITDSKFYDAQAMTEAQIQSFLSNKGSMLATLRHTAKSRSAAISDQARPGYVYCKAITGGSDLLSSTIIYRVQAACGISAKVILVTLEKERSLVTGRFSSAGLKEALNVAMGYGCPDTAACNTLYYGLDNQLYLGARQFKYYQLPENNFRYQPGAEYVQYHPDAARCGGTTVEVRNWATAALYNYTPYQPNRAALDSFPGTGNSCSSYGNRNFWFIYNQWFGSPTSVDGAFAINEAYELSGGAGGPLGAATESLDCSSSATSCLQEFDHGIIRWTKGSGAIVVSGTVGDRYLALGGPGGSLGPPTSAASSFSTVNGDGVVQIFQRGYLYSSAAGVFTVVPNTDVANVWVGAGWIRGSLGWPVSEFVCGVVGSGCTQEFQGGTVYLAANGSAATVDPPFAAAYQASGGVSGSLGYPMSIASMFTKTGNGDGMVQIFEGGYLYSSAAGVFKVEPNTPIADAWVKAGWIRGSLGWPVTDEVCGLPDGGCSQDFQHGTVLAGSNTAAGVTDPSIAAAYAAAGGAGGPLGYPKSPASAFAVPANGDGVVQIFEGGYLYSSAAGVFKVEPNTPIADAWVQAGWIRGSLGWPVAEKVCGLAGGGCAQEFQHGTTYAVLGIAAAVTDPKIAAAYAAAESVVGPLGYPKSPASAFAVPANGDGVVQIFEGGYLYSSAAGVFKVESKTAIADAWAQLGWIRGSLGWPVAEKVCGLAGGGCSQQFQHGTVYSASSGAAAAVTDPKISASYASLGGAGGPLGYPKSAASSFSTVNGDGVVQIFQNGYLYSSAAGVFQVEPNTPIADAWVKLGWIRGSLGWPVAEKVCAGGGCSQQFQGGTLASVS